MKQPIGLILAGGQATRMGGGDKSRNDLGGRSILSHVIERLEPQVSQIVLNANGDAGRFDDTGFSVVPDSIDGFAGPLAGVLAGLDWAAAHGASHVVSVAADTPFFPCDLVPQLILAAEAQDKPIALAASPDPVKGMMRHPTFGLWPVNLREDLRAALLGGLRKVVLWTDTHGTAQAAFPAPVFDPFFNVNTPHDLETARGLMEDL
ncbi:molybdenum cofactor guanylyltransferase MobA [Algirhabdus cladophorae]|uniref:molybdenum cofactor guanylyltransferase MobA n=1 Tax=Algirhabdus cladophorae TaxID=3377108 RepID=UPI003B847262